MRAKEQTVDYVADMNQALEIPQPVPNPNRKMLKGPDGQKIVATPEVQLRVRSAQSKDKNIIISEF